MQSIALVADIHSNILALEAILKDIRRKHKPDRIISLGDQINLGPAPRETLDLLKQENAVCLHGNHERYVLSAMRHDPAYAGANFASLEFNVKQLSEEEITFPKSLMIDGITFCHAMPDEDRCPDHDYNSALSRLQSMQSLNRTHIHHSDTVITLRTMRSTTSSSTASAVQAAWMTASPASCPTRCSTLSRQNRTETLLRVVRPCSAEGNLYKERVCGSMPHHGARHLLTVAKQL